MLALLLFSYMTLLWLFKVTKPHSSHIVISSLLHRVTVKIKQITHAKHLAHDV